MLDSVMDRLLNDGLGKCSVMVGKQEKSEAEKNE